MLQFSYQKRSGRPFEFKNFERLIEVFSADYFYRVEKRIHQYTVARKIERVTADQTQALASKYFDPEQMIVVAVGDRAKMEPGLKELNLGPVEVVP